MKKLYFIFISLIFTLILFIYSETLIAQSVNSNNSIVGIWKGILHASPRDSLSIILVVENCGDSVKVVLDSPDQYVTDIPVTSFSFIDDTLSFKAASLFVSFRGIYSRDEDAIKGAFIQGRKKMSLSFCRTSDRLLIVRPQTPIPPYDYVVEPDIVFNDPKSGLPLIMGTLTYPENKNPKGTVIMISGSGWQDRDESILGHKPFLVIADYLTRNGYAVFRYDDFPKYQFVNSTTYDFAENVTMIIDSLKVCSKFDLGKIGLLGHSEGGLVAFIVASQNPEIEFVISMAGVAETLKETLLFQNRIALSKMDYSEEEIKSSLINSGKTFTLVEKSKNVDKASEQMDLLFSELSKNMTDSLKVRYNSTPQDFLRIKQKLLSPWFYQLFKINPKDYIRKIDCPVYALNGEYDLQVNFQKNLPLIEQYLKKNPCNKIEMLPKMNHLFQEAVTGYYDEYGKIEQTIAPEVLSKIIEWLEKALICE